MKFTNIARIFKIKTGQKRAALPTSINFLKRPPEFNRSEPDELKILKLFEKYLNYLSVIGTEFLIFSRELKRYLFRSLRLPFIKFEAGKTIFATILYRERGKYAKRFIHSGMAGLVAFGTMIAPVVAEEFPSSNLDPWEIPSASSVLSAATSDPTTTTDISSKPRDKIIQYSVSEGDTVASIAEKFGVSVDTVFWQNSLTEKSKIKPGQTLEILPVSGISHKVSKGDTVYSISKKYDTEPQAVVDFPYNTFVNDETFELAIGQIVIVPNGVKPEEKQVAPRIRQITPDAGTVVASGAFVWPASGTISQGFAWYHKGLDIANRSAPSILAADSGTVVIAGWPDGYGYGNRVVIDHGNGFRTLYGHMSAVYVKSGQTVNRGDTIGKMGCTGRCTGTHLHFEVISNGAYLNPLSVLR